MDVLHAPWRTGLATLRAARGPQEKLGVARLAARNLRCRITGDPGGTSEVALNGVRLRVRDRGAELSEYQDIFLDGCYERVPGFAPRAGTVVIDGGANIGVFAIRHALAGARVHSFEPDPDTRERLRVNLELNDLVSSVRVHPEALGAAAGRASLERTDSSLETEVVADPTGEVTVTTIDDVVATEGIDHVGLVKLNIEGGEVATLQGARATLPVTDRVVVQYHSPALLAEVSEIMGDAGFRRAYLDEHVVFFDTRQAGAPAGPGTP